MHLRFGPEALAPSRAGLPVNLVSGHVSEHHTSHDITHGTNFVSGRAHAISHLEPILGSGRGLQRQSQYQTNELATPYTTTRSVSIRQIDVHCDPKNCDQKNASFQSFLGAWLPSSHSTLHPRQANKVGPRCLRASPPVRPVAIMDRHQEPGASIDKDK